MIEARPWRLVLAAILAASAGACASQRTEGEGSRLGDTGRGMAGAAVTPLRDVGLIRPEIPDAISSLQYPYQTAALAAGCPAIAYEIGQLDAVLGEESYQPGRETTLTSRGMDAAQGAAVDAVRDVVDVIPFRGWVRRASGAASAEKRADRAVELGHTRRTFLRGYGAALGCPGVVPAPPPPSENRERR